MHARTHPPTHTHINTHTFRFFATNHNSWLHFRYSMPQCMKCLRISAEKYITTIIIMLVTWEWDSTASLCVCMHGEGGIILWWTQWTKTLWIVTKDQKHGPGYFIIIHIQVHLYVSPFSSLSLSVSLPLCLPPPPSFPHNFHNTQCSIYTHKHS